MTIDAMRFVRFRQTTILDPASVAPYGSEAWALECKKKLTEAVDRAVGGQLQFDRDLREFWQHQGWKALKDATGQPFPSFRAFALAPRPHGLAIPPNAYKGLMQGNDAGLVKDKTPLQWVQWAWRKADADEQQRILQWLLGNSGNL